MSAAKKLNRELKSVPKNKKDDIGRVVDAINKVQAIIEFNLDGTVITANTNFLSTVGYDLGDIQGKHHRMFCDPEYANSKEYRAFWEKLGRGEFDAGEYRRLGRGGKEVWINASYNPIFDENGKPYKVIKFATDVTEQKNQSAEFEGKLNAISKAQAVIEFNLDGTIITANSNFLNTLGYDLSEIKGKHHRMFCDPDYANTREYSLFWEKLNRGEFDAGEYRRVGRGGKEVWINASYNPIFNANGKVYKVVKFASDVTLQKKRAVEFEKMVESVIETASLLSSSSMQLTATATQMSSSAKKTSEESQTAAVSAEEVATGVQTVATNVEEMVASIKEIARSTSESSQMAKTTMTKAQESNSTIVKLGASSQEIGDVIKVISSIAQQTNLLALNATIEAARAGEAGKGFAVVANEVKELAKQTAKATDDITHKIGAIQIDAQNAVEAIAGISQAVEKLNDISGVIAVAVEEQTASTNEISRVVIESKKGVENIADTIRTVSSVSEESMRSSEETLSASRSLSQLAEKLNGIVNKSSN